jgi:type VI protein secretion system component VasA
VARSGQLLLRFLTAPTIAQRRDRRIYASSAPARGAESRAAQWRLLSEIDHNN